MFIKVMCSKCLATHEYYQQRHEVPPCPFCGYPELKTKEEYYKSMGVGNEKSV
jgi:hypothetical protein